MKKKVTRRKVSGSKSLKHKVTKKWKLFWVSLGLSALIIIPLAQFANSTKDAVVLGASTSRKVVAETPTPSPTITPIEVH